MVALLALDFKHLPESLYISLLVTVIVLIARAVLRNAILGQGPWTFPSQILWWGGRAGRKGAAVASWETNRSVRLMDMVSWRGGISTGKIFILLEKSKWQNLSVQTLFSNIAIFCMSCRSLFRQDEQAPTRILNFKMKNFIQHINALRILWHKQLESTFPPENTNHSI